MSTWTSQIETLIAPALARSSATSEVMIAAGCLAHAGAIAARVTDKRHALVMADSAGFEAAGAPVVAALRAAGFGVETLVLPCDPLPKASVEDAEPFRAALHNDPSLFAVSVGSGVINDLVKYAAFQTDSRYMSVATAASMDGYTSAGAPLAEGGFKVTIPTRAPIAMLADLDIIAAAPAEMNGWGYGDLAGKIAAGGDWIVADALGVEAMDDLAWPLVQDNLRGWLEGPGGIAQGDIDTVARLFIGLTAVGFAMEFHASSRPASGADHQIAHMWEMDGRAHQGRKVSHGAAVAVGCVASLSLYDWLIAQDLSAIDIPAVIAAAPDLSTRLTTLKATIPDPRIALKAMGEVQAKHAEPDTHIARLECLKAGWPALQDRLRRHLIRAPEMAAMLRAAGVPCMASDIGICGDDLAHTLRAAAFIRRRYTIFDILHETGLMETALAAVLPKLTSDQGGTR